MSDVTDGWQFWIDRGGTFTDIVARTPDGRLLSRKLLSENAAVYEDAALEGIRRLMSVPGGAPIPAERIAAVKMGTTVATNALLERRGDPTLLVITKGLADQLEIGTQARPHIFARRIVKPDMLYVRVLEANERVRADGTVEQPLNLAHLRAELEKAKGDGIGSVAIVFMHAYAFPEHERQAARLARDLGFPQVSTSHDVSPLIKIVGRGDTTVADAYLSPILGRYVSRVAKALGENGHAMSAHQAPLQFMASSGGLKSGSVFQGRDAILSGPAGGIVGMAETARAAGFKRVIGFDMGGTSTDVSHFAGTYERVFETEVAGVRLRVPMLRIHTVAAGGGSILTFDGARFRVGPESAGSNPGPLCYRRGGPLTVTDANVMVGKLDPATFPAIFGADGSQPIDSAAVSAAFSDLAQRVGDGRSPVEVADGFIRIAVDNMANAIKKISVERGYDVTRYVLNAFGSASGQHACLIADTLNMDTVLIHPLSGLLSAYGMGLAPLRASRERTIERVLSADTLHVITDIAYELAYAATGELESQGVARAATGTATSVHLRYEDTETALPVPLTDTNTMRREFERLHRQRFGFVSPEKSIFVALVEVEATGGGTALEPSDRQETSGAQSQPHADTRFFSQGRWHTARVVGCEALRRGDELAGPAIIVEPHQTVIVEPGWRLTVSPRNDLVLTRSVPRKRTGLLASATRDPVLLEVFNNLFMNIAEQMGEALRATAQSVNIKERLDFSCAIFDASGALVANAPHVPVHLGSMDRSVETVIREHYAEMRPGDSYMLNAPYNGGTHLPDITVVTPVFATSDESAESTPEILFYVASRGHHADIGGIAPGSMSPDATSIEEEGVYIDNVKLVTDGRFLETETLTLLSRAKYPARKPAQNIADLKAQVAANARGVSELRRAVAEFGADVVSAYMAHVQDNAETAVRRLISRLDGGHFRVETDQGTHVAVRVTVDKKLGRATIDFTGTSPQQSSTFNAPEPVTRAAVLYVFRVLLDEPIPMNAGCLRPLSVLIPDGSMLKPRYPAPVAAGNVETSQIVTNALFAAVGGLGSAQGTMNNLTFGNAHVQYYETVCSGAPAGPGFDGAAGVHVHMTNTRLTDPEVLELRYPVVLEEFSIRRGSGGKGRWTSGDGTRRVIRFLERMEVSLTSGYRRVRPFGFDGGEPGACGLNLVRRLGDRLEHLDGCCRTTLEAGEAIDIETPTGGGFGAAES